MLHSSLDSIQIACADLPCRDTIQSRRLGFGHRSLRRRPPEAPRRRPSTSCEASRLPAARGPQAPSLPRAGAFRPPGCWRRTDACLPAGLLPVATSTPHLFGNGRLQAAVASPPDLHVRHTFSLPLSPYLQLFFVQQSFTLV